MELRILSFRVAEILVLSTFLLLNAYEIRADAKFPDEYTEALELIHEHNGAGSELQEAIARIDSLAVAYPDSGYSETLSAELLSTWALDRYGEPQERREHVLELIRQALELDPDLAQAYVAKARTLVRIGDLESALEAVDRAIEIDPELGGALFVQGDIARIRDQIENAERWYLAFIAVTPNKSRQSNAYYWLGEAYLERARRDFPKQEEWLAKARQSYEKMVLLDPDGAWKNVNFAIFLNSYTDDFETAERYALAALTIMDFRMARMHLAISRYLQVWKTMPESDQATMKAEIGQIESMTGISLADASNFASPGLLKRRLTELEALR